jgi:hypothetical protein
MLTGYRIEKGWRVATGCFDGTVDEFEARVKAVHAGTLHEREYLAACAYLRVKFGAAAGQTVKQLGSVR